MLLSIVIPAYREARYIGNTLDALHRYLAAKHWLATTEVIVVTADAPDNTAEIVRAKPAAFPHARHIQPGPKVGTGRRLPSAAGHDPERRATDGAL